jgi:DNA-binding FadR family transcriptional regulator
LGIVSIAVNKITDEQICILETLVAELEENIHSPEIFIEKDLAIHNFFVNVADNKLLEIFMNSLVRLGRESRYRTTNITGVPELVVEQHKKILDSVRKRDQISAVAAMEDHLSFLAEKLKD